MSKIISNGYSVKITLTKDIDLSSNDKELINYALSSYSYVNNEYGQKYELSIQQWIRNILNTFDSGSYRTKQVLSALNKII